MTTKLYRSTTDKKIFGVCGGLGQALNVDSTLLRFIVVVATIFSGGTAGLLYLVAGLVIPEEPAGYAQHQSFGYGYGADDAYTGQKSQSFWGGGCNKQKKTQSSYAGHGTGSHTSYMHGSSGGATHGGIGRGGAASHAAEQQSGADELDELMREVEAKALRKEIEELKQRLAIFENHNEQSKGDI